MTDMHRAPDMSPASNIAKLRDKTVLFRSPRIWELFNLSLFGGSDQSQ